MNVVVEPLPNCLTTLRVEVDPQKVSETQEAVTRDFGQGVRIPGYRPGKAPREVIERKFRKQIREEMERKLLQETTRQAISEKGLRVLQLANIEDVKLGDDNSLSYTATVIIQPEFALPQYKGIAVDLSSEPVTDAEVESSLEEMREQAADFLPIEEARGAQMEDFIVVDYDGTIGGQPVQEAFPKGGKPLSTNRDFWIKMTEEAFFPGFCAALVGVNKGETTTFTVEVPADFPVEGMPGQKIDYQVTLREIMRKVLPEMDDAFAATIAEGKTLAEVRVLAHEELVRQHLQADQTRQRKEIMRQLLSWVECELPTGLVRQETQRVLGDIVRENQARGVSEEILKESQSKLVGSASHTARELLKGNFILLRIAEVEKLQITREELFGRIAVLAERSNMPFEKMLKELEKRQALDHIKEEILTSKTLDFLVQNATSRPAAAAAPAALPESSAGESAPTVQG